MDEQRVADYFVVAGLGKGALPLEEVTNEAAIKPAFRKDPITDVAVINRSAGEKIPANFQCLETTPTGFPANLNHGAIRCPDMFICYKRGQDKPPLKDIGILYEGKERVMEGCEVVHTTPFGRPANINNSNSSRIYITYRRASENAASDTLVVVDICVILANKGEEPPLTYNQILKNLNKGMVGSDVYLCYKKAMVKTDVLAYKPTILGRYPEEDYDNFPLPESVPMFCLPMGATIECWAAQAKHPNPTFSTFILTISGGDKVYGAAVSFYEEYVDQPLSDMQLRTLGLKNHIIREQFNIDKTVHVRKAICLLSHWPFFDAFKKFLSQLYKISTTGPHTVPIERHISHFMFDVPYPSPQRPRILVQLAHESISLCMPEDSPLPQSGASFITLLRNLGPELCMNLLLYVLLENKILLHSLRPTVLTEVAEAVTSMIFPFHWQCPYIPLCPLGLSAVLNAPCPFIVGIDSRYFDLYDPPPDIICVDLDTARIWLPDDKMQLNFKMMPKKAVRSLQDALLRLFEMSSPPIPSQTNEEINLELANVDLDFRRKKKQMQLEMLIQEAFLHFMAIVLRDYKAYLNPIMRQPNNRATDASVLFDMQGFLKSREKTNAKFYTQMMKTQMFFRFIEERSFVSDKDASLAFFDECIETVSKQTDEMKEELRLIEIDNSQTSERTVFIMPPEPTDLPEGVKYSYKSFPSLRPELFLKKKLSTLSLPSKQVVCPNSPVARRSKQEVKSAQKLAQQHVGNPRHWAKCLSSHCFSLWFISFPAYVHTNPKKMEALKVGYAVLQKMHAAKLPFVDQICYRVLMQLAGQYNKPGLAVQVFSLMKHHGIQPNAITYGYYNRVMLEAKWPSPKSKGKLCWTKIRNVIFGVAQFRRAIRRRSLSLYSNSGSEFDQISHASMDSYLDDHGDKSSLEASSASKVVFHPETREKEIGDDLKIGVSPSIGDIAKAENTGTATVSVNLEDRMSNISGGVSDRGYNTMTQEDVHNLTELMTSGSENVPSTISAPAALALDHTDMTQKTKAESWLPFGFTLRTKKLRHHSEKSRTEPSYQQHRNRCGSIVRKSITSFNEEDSIENFKATLLGNSAGLLIVSQIFLENGCYLTSGNFRLEVEEAARRRHKSETSRGGKPTRSMSLFASWRPKHLINGDTKSSQPLMRFSQLARNEEDDVSISSLHSTEDSHQKPGTVTVIDTDFSSGERSHIKDSGVGLDEPAIELGAVGSGEGFCVDENYLLSEKEETSSVINNKAKQDNLGGGDGSSVPTIDIVSGACLETGKSSAAVSAGQQLISDTSLCMTKLDTSSSDNAALSSGLSPSYDASAFNKPNSAVCLNGQKDIDLVSSPSSHLAEVGHALSLPSVIESNNIEPSLEMHTPVRKQSSVSDPVHPSNDPRKESTTEYVMRRTQSLRRTNEMMQKTNEAISGFLKFASKAAYSKFNELKQSITTPLKNAASLSSLTRSSEDLDGTGSEQGSCGGGGSSNGDCNSSTSGTIKEQHRVAGSHDMLSTSESSCINGSGQRLSQTSFGENSFGNFAPASYLDSFRPTRDQRLDSVSTHSGDASVMSVAVEVEMSSCSRCNRCHRLVYDEEIMAGWSADDSNLNTSCSFCPAKFVPNLQVFVKDWRGHRKSVVLAANSDTEGHDLAHSIASPAHISLPQTTVEECEDENDDLEMGKKEGEMVSSMHLDAYPLSLQQAAAAVRRRCTSECLSDATGNIPFGSSMEGAGSGVLNYLPGGLGSPKSPLNLSFDEDAELPFGPAAVPEMKKDFMTRSTCTAEPLVFQYLSPLVLRKELEYVLDHEGDLCLADEDFLDQHPIIFWNLVWYFRRLEVPSHLPSLLLTAKSFNSPEVIRKYRGQYDSRNILIRPMWDNIRIHDELGLPMYMAWNAGHRSTVVDALVTESESFSRPLMFQVITSIQRNDVLSAIKHVASGRRRLLGPKRRFRSMYREILFLSFVACGRENIDHDAFDREYALAFEEKLTPAEIRRLQIDDKPRSASVQWCRRVFCELEV